jgi:uncharacterized repeat protein (TIGR03803 family)
MTLILASGAWPATEQVIYSVAADSGGYSPHAGLIFDAAGNLYGTTALGEGGKKCGTECGMVFELSPASGGGWTETVLHVFTGNDGSIPIAGLVFDKAGNLYGTTQFGGVHNWGVVFELTPDAGGGWTEKVLHSFSGPDGQYPSSGLAIDAAGNLYGTAEFGGSRFEGVAFELMPTPTGWKHKVLRNFGLHGIRPYGGLVLDSAGNLYGTTTGGGSSIGAGVVFELTPNTKGVWNEIVLYEFQGGRHGGKDGRYPLAGLVFDGQGNLYGTTAFGGVRHHGRGMIFKLTPSSDGSWKKSVLHYGGHKGGYGYIAALVFDTAGNLYGTATVGGGLGRGVVFRLKPTTSGFWTEEVLHSFGGGSDGAYPYADLIWDTAGNLYGTTTQGGGSYEGGTVFEITP